MASSKITHGYDGHVSTNFGTYSVYSLWASNNVSNVANHDYGLNKTSVGEYFGYEVFCPRTAHKYSSQQSLPESDHTQFNII